MLFTYKTSNKKLISLGISVFVNLLLFFAFQFFIKNLVGLSVLFLAALVMNAVLFILQYMKGAQYEFFENEIRIETKKESKTLSSLNLLFVQCFLLHRNAKEKMHLVTSEGEHTFTEGEDDNFMLLKDYLFDRVQVSDVAKYHFHLHEIKVKIPSMIASLLFLISYLFYFNELGFNSLFFKIILFIQGGSLLLYVGQWFYYHNKIKKMSTP